LHFDRLSNFRDFGGLPAANGQTLTAGLLFRSAELSRLTAHDAAQLRAAGIKLICDLRAPGESRKKPPHRLAEQGFRIVNIPIHDQPTHDALRKRLLRLLVTKTASERFPQVMRDYYHHIAFERATFAGQVITLLARDGSLPALIHCTAGKDRTGLLAAILQLLAGVPFAFVMTDYLRTNDAIRPEVERAIRLLRLLSLFQIPADRMRQMAMAHPDPLHQVYEHLIQRHGTIEQYLTSACNVDFATLQQLKRRLVE
jgi:protein-tyrosine phosphatase